MTTATTQRTTAKVITFPLYTTLPDLNAQLKRAKTSPYSYAAETKRAVEDIAWEIKAYFSPKVPTINEGFAIVCCWHVTNKRRDPDNIAFGIKYILDGMQSAGLIANDGFNNVSGGILHSFQVSPRNPHVSVQIRLGESLFLP